MDAWSLVTVLLTLYIERGEHEFVGLPVSFEKTAGFGGLHLQIDASLTSLAV